MQAIPRPTRPDGADGRLRSRLGIPDGAALVLYVGRIAAGKGIEHLLAVADELTEAHIVLAGPDDRHGMAALDEPPD